MDDDLPLIEALQAGDDSALNTLIDRHREPLFNFVFRYLRDETVARDVMQETFVRVYFKVAQFKPKSTVKTWLYTIALNLCRDHARRLGRRRGEVSLEAPAQNGETSPFEVADTAPSPSSQANQSDRFGLLHRAIAKLPHKLKSALVLFSLEGRSQQEVADLLGTTPKTVELRVYHAKTKLRDSLRGELRANATKAGDR